MTDIMKLFIKDAVENMFKTNETRGFNDDIKYIEGSVKYTIREGGVYYNELMLDINYLEAVKVSEELSKSGITVGLPNRPDSEFLNTEFYTIKLVPGINRDIELTCNCEVDFSEIGYISRNLDRAIELGCIVDKENIIASLYDRIINNGEFKYSDPQLYLSEEPDSEDYAVD